MLKRMFEDKEKSGTTTKTAVIAVTFHDNGFDAIAKLGRADYACKLRDVILKDIVVPGFQTRQ